LTKAARIKGARKNDGWKQLTISYEEFRNKNKKSINTEEKKLEKVHEILFHAHIEAQ
jgi:hypothetical protein